ncbi:hypothetical protein VNO78_19994 [Psophocarpus tetragonolobus]|uniref:Uncharacterized protein n=1 Tax=Psophocarpus tetragonolobus TaxID=3891 RepID=A0AAN9S927_PSOTE
MGKNTSLWEKLRCLGNITCLGKIRIDNPVDYSEHMDLYVKGRSMEYTIEMHVINLIDLSNNHLSGKTPQTLTELSYLISLNLSWNQLTRDIPTNIVFGVVDDDT